MIDGHGDDGYLYEGSLVNFSSNVYAHFNHTGLLRHLADCLENVRHYPQPAPFALERRLAQSLGTGEENVMVTNGATEAIYLIAQAYHGDNSTVVCPTFSEYADACEMHGHDLTNFFAPPGSAIIDVLHQLPSDTDLVWLCVPSNPTGEVQDSDSLLRTIRRTPELTFVVDASYAPYSLLPQIDPADGATLPNLLLIHSFTKQFGIPGLRLGYVTGPETLISRLKQQRMPWAVNQLAQDAGLYLLDHKDDYRLPVKMLTEERRRVASELQHIEGFAVYPSDCHILLCRLTEGRACDLKEWLAKQHGILIRDASNFEGLGQGHFRIAVQNPDENDILLNALRQWTAR